MTGVAPKSPRPGSLLDLSTLPPPPQPPQSTLSDVNGTPGPNAVTGASVTSPPRQVWGVRPTAQKPAAATQGRNVPPLSSQGSTGSLLSSSQSAPLPPVERKDSGTSTPSALSQSHPQSSSLDPPQFIQASPSNRSAAMPGLEDKFLRSPSAPVFEAPPKPDEITNRGRQTLPSKAAPPRPISSTPEPAPTPPVPTPSSTATPPSSPLTRTSSNSTPSTHNVLSASAPNLRHSATSPVVAAAGASGTGTLERLSSGSARQLVQLELLPGDTPDTEQNTLYDERNVLKAATPAKIIEKLTHPAFDSAFTLDCVLTYPLFCASASEFLDSLVLRFQNVQHNGSRRKIINEVLRTWIEVNFDWSVEPNLRAFLQTIRQAKTPDSAVLVPDLFDLIDRMTRRMREGYNCFSALPVDAKLLKPLMPKDLSKVHTIEDIHPKEMARQITLLASDIYKKIRVSELTKQAWSKKDKEKNAPNVLHLINRFNKTSLWVASMCVLPETVPARASTMSYFIKVAKEMRELKNYDGMISIINGLENSSVLRLKQSWKFVDGISDLQAVKDMMTFDGNYKTYREHLASLDGTEPAVPFIAPFLGDLTFIDENPNQINGLFNFGKCRLIAKSIHTALKFQKIDYPFEQVPMVQKYLAKIKLPEEADIYEVSIKREKKGEEDKAASIMVETLFS